MNTPAASPALRAIGVSVRIGESLIIDKVDLDVPAGQITALVGPNGAGKSTLFDCLSSALPAATGTILLNGRNVTHSTADQRSRLGIARTFQHVSVFPTLTVEENLRVGAEHRENLQLLRALFRGRRADAPRTPQIVEEMLERTGLTALRGLPARNLETSTLRLVEIGRALCTKPTVLMLDEPASGLDDSESDRLRDLLSSLAAGGLAILLVEHDLTLVGEVAQNLCAIARGRVVSSGPAQELLASRELVALVGGTRSRRGTR
jgi:branched-chain amino acid transport system ATP-binding protein